MEKAIFHLEGGRMFLRNVDMKNTRRNAIDVKRTKYITWTKKRTTGACKLSVT
jgi:hypothetical protein